MENKEQLTGQNIAFWNELCGTGLAKEIGITDHSLTSLKRFDQAYFDTYPYLQKYVPTQKMAGKKVLEVGLGYGTLGQKMAEAGADYLGLDIAATPVEMMKHRLSMAGLPGNVLQQSILTNTLHSNSFDYVVSIGCFHHTGDVKLAIDQTYRLLKPGGTAIIMVYNRFSGRQWRRWKLQTLKALITRENPLSSEEQRRAYDANSVGGEAPETVFLSKRDLKRLFGAYTNVKMALENCDPYRRHGRVIISRESMLPWFGPVLGLDIYVVANK